MDETTLTGWVALSLFTRGIAAQKRRLAAGATGVGGCGV